jgi:hypothetical protein
MKKILFYVIVLFCLALVAYKAFFYFDRQSEQKEVFLNKAVTRLNDVEMSKIRTGDIILRRGFGFFSDHIASTLNHGITDVTHAGIIVKRNNTWCVIHSLSSDVTDVDGVQIQTLSDFLQYSAPDKIIVTRAKNSSSAFGNTVAVRAEYYLKKKIPFDHQGIIDNDSELFCTELIWKILEKDLHYYHDLPVEHSARKKFFYSMAQMYNTAYYGIIVNQYDSINIKK